MNWVVGSLCLTPNGFCFATLQKLQEWASIDDVEIALRCQELQQSQIAQIEAARPSNELS